MTLPATNHRATAVCYVGASGASSSSRTEEGRNQTGRDGRVGVVNLFPCRLQNQNQASVLQDRRRELQGPRLGLRLRVRGLPSLRKQLITAVEHVHFTTPWTNVNLIENLDWEQVVLSDGGREAGTRRPGMSSPRHIFHLMS